MNYEYDIQSKSFIINTRNKDYFISTPLVLIPEYDPKYYEMHIMRSIRSDACENSIYSVYLDGIRVGWIFPVESLRSEEHEYAKNQFFLKYAYIAYCKIIHYFLQKENFNKIEDCYLEIEDLMGIDSKDIENLHVLLIDTENTDNEYSFDKYKFGLYVSGYIEDITHGAFSVRDYDALERRLNVTKISDDLVENESLMLLINDTVPNTSDDYSRFMILYQVIEILIGKVFDIQFRNIIDKYRSDNDLYGLKEDISDISNERTRVNILFNEHCSIAKDHRMELRESCIEILDINTNNMSVPDLLYRVRCLMVHRFYSMGDLYKERLKMLDEAFEQVVYDILVSYKHNN